MIQNYIKIAWRNFLRNKSYSLINVLGLAIGLACCFLILLFVRAELNYDRFHKKADQIYRVVMNSHIPNAPPDRFAISNWLNAPTLLTEYPEVENMSRLAPWSAKVKRDGEYFLHDDFFFADSTFFNVFTFPLTQGESASALRDPFSIVISEEMEQKYFGAESGLGKSIILNDTLSFMVTGVISEVPMHSHFNFDFLISWATFENLEPVTDQYTYVLLKENVSPETFESKISDLIMLGNYGDQLRGNGIRAELELQPLMNIYLHSDRRMEIGPTGNVQYIYIFAAIAIFILLIACINFMNLTTARSIERAKEIGVRKVVGARPWQLIWQFWSEALLLSVIGMLIAVLLVESFLPIVNDLSGKSLQFAVVTDWTNIVMFIGLTLIAGLMAGCYPAFVLSSFKPVEVLKNVFKSSQHGVRLQQGLVIFQFAISITLIVGTLIVFQQLNFMQHQDLGFEKEQVVVVDGTGIPDQQMKQQYQTVKQELKQHPSVREVSASNVVPGRGSWVGFVSAEGLAEKDSRRMQVVVTDHDFPKTMGIELVAGRYFSEEYETDAQEAVLLNEAAVENFGWSSPEEALGKYIGFGDDQEFIVVGVLQNYHHQSLRQKIEPMFMRIMPSTFNFFSVRFSTQNASALLENLEKTWKRLFPGVAFEYFFLDVDFNKQYQAEHRLFRIFGTFAFLAILIACLGLFGLVSFVMAQRTKEIGIRKVLGATVANIVALLTKDFILLVTLGFVIAVPVAWYAMNRWLMDFAYRIEIGAGIFVLAGVVALVIALLTVSWQSIKVALANPVDSLRSE